ncbi:hypothetical protein KQX54_006802 [Cotesia glomerata]|uniref:EB domain-containing protein n=1 Tax=Cotesia glomerata TaxID=32391 RepID=A0AAV7HU71_COTGL|nr:hypothetical protein KQX54_006802 [Cotesia glomerata]
MPRQVAVTVLAGVALILGVNTAQTDPPTNCVEFSGTCNLHHRCCGGNLKCDQSITLGRYECKEKAKLGDSWRETFHCIDILHSVCSKKSCLSSTDCGIVASYCFENKCQCISDLVALTDTMCAKRSGLYHCDDALDCGEPWHSKCSQNRCVCNANHIAVTGLICLPSLSGNCWRDDQCMTDNTHCIDFICQCKPGFVSVAINMCVAS